MSEKKWAERLADDNEWKRDELLESIEKLESLLKRTKGWLATFRLSGDAKPCDALQTITVINEQFFSVVEKTAKGDVGWIDEASPVVDMLEDGAKKFAKSFRKLIELAREESGKNLA